ncbi:DUF6503 family protein [Algibacter amylolyticus]|uniref:DUF6503 family protein n=1 Tax=Algibacter amylolyticus TaxID=1608400 RepID=UPI00155AEF02|nr:DUF6503 family protein [Algibacter amylolyticus]MBB5268999.1 hypothetical protein [Algibacter amylolyticus]
MLKNTVLLLVLIGLNYSCKKPSVDADAVINQSIMLSGGERFKTSTIAFNFRDKQYRAKHNNGNYVLERYFTTGHDSIVDRLTNDGFERFINRQRVVVPDSIANLYSASVNSVHYFSVLPIGLNAEAVNKHYVSQVSIKGEPYHKIKVTFNEDGGGEDFDDVFLYWVHSKTYKVDYLAYSYHEGNGLGMRFREAYNERYVNGIRFVDYNNYKPISEEATLLNLDVLFAEDELKMLSKIELEGVRVSYE